MNNDFDKKYLEEDDLEEDDLEEDDLDIKDYIAKNSGKFNPFSLFNLDIPLRLILTACNKFTTDPTSNKRINEILNSADDSDDDCDDNDD